MSKDRVERERLASTDRKYHNTTVLDHKYGASNISKADLTDLDKERAKRAATKDVTRYTDRED
jgi:hypothetical protein